MAPWAAPNVLDVAGQLLDDHRPAPGLPADVAVHAAAVLAGERPRYTEVSRSGGRRLQFTLVTPTRVVQISVPSARPAVPDGGDVETDVWPLETLKELRLLPPRPRPAADDRPCPRGVRWDGCRWLLAFTDRPPVRLPVAPVPSSVHRVAATTVAKDLLARPPRPRAPRERR